MTATWTGSAWSCTVRLLVRDDRVLHRAAADLRALLERVDVTASRFRADSALSAANARAGRPTPVPRLLVELVDAALDAAAATDGAVDPTLGRDLRRIGYDRDIADVRTGVGAGAPAVAADPTGRSPLRRRGWRSVRLHREAGLLTVPTGTELDLGATAKAWTADRAARTLAGRYETPVLVELGGDVAVAGGPADGWTIQVAEREGTDGQLVQLWHGGLTTSTTVIRTWEYGDAAMHHILDPTTGLPTTGPWRTASVWASSALAANTSSTAAIVRGADAPQWLAERGVAARLVHRDGSVVTTPGWPAVHPVAPTSAGSAAGTAARDGAHDLLVGTGLRP